MSPAEVEIKTVKIGMSINKDVNLSSDPTKLNDKYKSLVFSGKHEKILFDGHLKVTNNKSVSKKNVTKEDEDEDDDADGENADNGESETSNDSEKVKIKEDKNLEKLFDSLKKGQEVFCFSINSEEK